MLLIHAISAGAGTHEVVPRVRLVSVPESNDPSPLCRPEAFNEILSEE